MSSSEGPAAADAPGSVDAAEAGACDAASAEALGAAVPPAGVEHAANTIADVASSPDQRARFRFVDKGYSSCVGLSSCSARDPSSVPADPHIERPGWRTYRCLCIPPRGPAAVKTM